MTREPEVSVVRDKARRRRMSALLIGFGSLHLVLSAMVFLMPELVQETRGGWLAVLCLIVGPLLPALYLHFEYLKNVPSEEST